MVRAIGARGAGRGGGSSIRRAPPRLPPIALALTDYRELAGKVDAAIVAVPTSAHAEIGCALMEAGIDVLVEKPIAPDLASADRLVGPPNATDASCRWATWSASIRP